MFLMSVSMVELKYSLRIYALLVSIIMLMTLDNGPIIITERETGCYANEVGEAFRSQVHVNIVRLSYGIASSYVVADAIHKGFKASEVPWQTEEKRNLKVRWAVFDTLVWQGLASVIIPGFTINRTCFLCNFILKKQASVPQKTRKWITTFIGLACIPFIIKPIDLSVDFFMEKTLRRYYRYEGHIMKTIIRHTREDS